MEHNTITTDKPKRKKINLRTVLKLRLEKCRHCGASLSEFADVAHGRAYAAVQTYMYVDVRTYVRKLCAEFALPSAL